MKLTRLIKPQMVIVALLAAFALGMIACASEPAEPSITAAEIRQIVADEVSKSAPAPQQQVTAAEIQSMVESTMSSAMTDMSSSQVSAAEIQSMVESAVSSAAAEGASPAEIQSMVESAVNAATADAVTGADVQSAITKAVSDAQAGMITSADVETAVSSAVSEAQAGMVTSADVESAVSSAVMQAVANSLTAEEIESIVSQALDERAMMGEGPPKETIVFSDLNWTSAQVQNRIAQYIVEHGYGYPTDQILGATLPNFQGLQKGDIHVALEIWLPNQSIGWEKAIEIGDVVSVGTSLVGDWQSTFVVPKYLADAHPDLKTPQDLKKPEFQELFASDDSRGKARHVACVIGWSCELVNTAQITAYGLDDYLHVINPGSQEAMFAELYGAFEKETPWLGYMWGTGDPALKLDLVRLEEPPYTQECWDTDKACAFAESLVLVAVHKSLLPRAPEVIGMLQNWEFTIDIYKSIFQWMDANPGSEASEAAVWFLNNNKVWESWVTPEAAAAVNAALADGS